MPPTPGVRGVRYGHAPTLDIRRLTAAAVLARYDDLPVVESGAPVSSKFRDVGVLPTDHR